MMIYFAALAFLTGWLVIELKDFMAMEGVKNSLAFILLKLSFIFVTFGLIISRLFFPEILARSLEQMAQKARLAFNEPLRYRNNSGSLATKHRRTNSE
jgi:hypothetical protein